MRHDGRDGRGVGAAHALAGLLGLGGGGAGALAAMASLAHSQIHERSHLRSVEREDRERSVESSYQMSVPNELIGSVIGKLISVAKVTLEISGAIIRISKSDDPNTSPSTERQIMITVNVALPKSLINMSLDLHKASLERGNDPD